MKKLLIALMLFAGIQLTAQTKEVADALKAYSRAKARTEHPKHSTKPKTWTDLAEAYSALYDAPLKSVWIGASEMEVKMLLKEDRVVKSEEVVINDTPLLAEHYEDKILYFSRSGELVAWKVLKQAIDKPLLERVYSSIEKAVEIDDRGSRSSDIKGLLEALKVKYYNEAMSHYTLGNFAEASLDFEKSTVVGGHPILDMVDTAFVYYAGMTAFMARDYERSVKFFSKSIEMDFDSDGDAYSYLAESYKALGDAEKSKEILNDGFTKHPSAQSILVSLINAYIETNDDPAKILDLIKFAQGNEPKNATLHYAEGNVWKNLDEFDKAIEAYGRSVEIDPNYYFGYFAIGAAYYDKAVDIQTAASEEMDDTKYEAMVVELENYLESAREPFEMCFETADDLEIKSAVAEYLKNIYFRFREKSDDYLKAYEKYNSFLKE